MAELTADPEERAAWLTFVVVGAGPTGVELVGQIAELAHTVLPRDYRSVNTKDARIVLLEGAATVLPPFAPELQRYTQEALERMGVEVRLNTLAVDMDHHSITVKGPDGVETIPARTRIWAAGVQASPLARDARAEGGAGGRSGGAHPGRTRLHARRASGGVRDRRHGVAGHAARCRAARDPGGQVRRQGDQGSAGGDGAVEPFKYFDKGSMATIGYRAAVADAFGMKFTGLVAYVMWMFVHMLYLIGWGNRLGTIYTWLRALVFSNNRGHRIITFEQVSGRLHEETSGTRAILPHGKEV